MPIFYYRINSLWFYFIFVSSLYIFYCIYLLMHTCIYREDSYPRAHVWKLEDNLWESVLDFYHVGSEDQTQASSPGSRHLCPLSHLISPPPLFLSVVLVIELRILCVRVLCFTGELYPSLVSVILSALVKFQTFNFREPSMEKSTRSQWGSGKFCAFFFLAVKITWFDCGGGGKM